MSAFPESRIPNPESLQDWLAHLERLHPQAIALGLERVAVVRDRMGLQPVFPVITVGGTNGKGSTCALLEAMLRAAGYRVGCYTSPHLLAYNERVRIDSASATDAMLVQAFEHVERARQDTSLTYFEFGTLAAMAAFIDAGVEVAILEVGLGGRLDAVNAFDADGAIVTTVDLDHQDWLGDTREQIGWEKAHIYRSGRPAICGDRDPPPGLTEHARAIGADLLVLGRDFDAVAMDGQWRYAGPGGARHGLPPPVLRGDAQLGNAACAIALLDALRARLPVALQDVRAGLLTAAAPARFQVLPGRPALILDVAHNPQAARALAANLARMQGFKRTHAVFGILADKDAGEVIRALAPEIDRWFVGGIAGPRGRSATDTAALIERHAPAPVVTVCADVAAAWRAATSAAGPDDRIAAFGSFLTVAAVVQLLHAQGRPVVTR
ncbi:MAG: bifunctional tetrahydrofolate synthase/dihydrofolate synthase [Burkholderiales bacterium]